MDKYPSTTNNNNYILIKPSLQKNLDRLPIFSTECCIYRVPRHLQMFNEGAYTPLVVSIGPLQRHHDHLKQTEIHKLEYLKSFLNRSRHNPNCTHDFEGFLKIVRTHEDKIRMYYADPMVTQINSQDLVDMVLVDAAFLIELFSRRNDTRLINGDDQMFNRPRMVVEVSHDIRLEENQIPFFILSELYSAAGFDKPLGSPKFIDIACTFLNISKNLKVDRECQYTYKHFLDLLRYDFLPSQLRSTQTESNPKDSADQSSSGCFKWSIPRNEYNEKKEHKNIVCKSATTLHEAGVKFKLNKDSKCKPLDIEFNSFEGTLSIPQLLVQDDTEALLKNLAVFEQCHYFDDSYIIDYISFLDFLINTPEDVALLVEEGIIENWLGSDEKVSDLFNGLNKHLRMRAESFYYAKVSKELDEYYNQTWNHHRAVLRQKYFNHPWATISVVYAIVLLLLTILQAVTGVISALPSTK